MGEHERPALPWAGRSLRSGVSASTRLWKKSLLTPNVHYGTLAHMATENLLTPGEATERLAEHNVRVTVRTVRRWIASGALPSYELPNGRRVVPESALAAMLPADTETAA